VTGQTNSVRASIGLALSGGGIRGMAHVGVIKALLENKVPIDLISGTSAGAIIATMYACGYSCQQMVSISNDLELNELLDYKIHVNSFFKSGLNGLKLLFSGNGSKLWSKLPLGLVKGDRIEEVFRQFWSDKTLRDTKIPLAITAVDIVSGDTVFFTTPTNMSRSILNARYYHSTRLCDAVRASISIPGIFFPKQYRGMMLVDGAVKNNLPTDILRLLGAQRVIAVDLGYSGEPNLGIQTIGDVLLQCVEIMGREVTLLKSAPLADVIIRPALPKPNPKTADWMAALISAGEASTLTMLSSIRKAISSVKT